MIIKTFNVKDKNMQATNDVINLYPPSLYILFHSVSVKGELMFVYRITPFYFWI